MKTMKTMKTMTTKMTFSELKSQINAVIELFEIDNGQLPDTIVLPKKNMMFFGCSYDNGGYFDEQLTHKTIFTMRTGRKLKLRYGDCQEPYAAIMLDNWDWIYPSKS